MGNEIKKLEYKVFAVLGGPWLGPATDANRAYHDHQKKVKPAREKVEQHSKPKA